MNFWQFSVNILNPTLVVIVPTGGFNVDKKKPHVQAHLRNISNN